MLALQREEAVVEVVRTGHSLDQPRTSVDQLTDLTHQIQSIHKMSSISLSYLSNIYQIFIY